MQIFESKNKPFRYPLPGSKGAPEYSKFLTGVRVAAVHVDPALIDFRKTQERLRAELGTGKGHLAYDEFGEYVSGRIARVLKPYLRDLVGIPAMKYLGAGMGVFEGGAESYHHDSPMVGCLFGAWHLGGPDREVRFSELDLVVPFTTGTLLLFDQMQPHAMLRPGVQVYNKADYADDDDVTLLSITVSKKPKARELLGIDEYRPTKHRNVRHAPVEYSVCPATGDVVGMH